MADHRQPDGAEDSEVGPGAPEGKVGEVPPAGRGAASATLGSYARVIRPLETRIQAEVRRTGAAQWIVETDYALGHVLAAVVAHPGLAQTLVFKGGTALKK